VHLVEAYDTMEDKNILEALKKLRAQEDLREKKINFDQTLDLIINLREFDPRKQAFSTFVTLPKRFKEKKIAGFFEKDSTVIDAIKKDNFVQYKEKKDIKKLIKQYDSFVANAKLMPAIATSFGRVLGPAGKMPNPQLGIIPNEEPAVVKAVVDKINSTVRVMVKEPSIKVGVGKVSLKDEDLVGNIDAVYRRVVEQLPKGKDNIRNIKIKFTMGKPVTVTL
jgi:large subunit ribosomal protein L1